MKKVIVLIIIATFGLTSIHSQTDVINASIEYLSKNKKSPEEYIISKFKNADIILLAENHAVKENLELLQSIIPQLHKNGIYNIGMEFGASEDQEKLDSLITAEEYNEEIAREIMFNYNSGWAFKEYMDIYRKAWEFNKSLPSDNKKFRIVNLSYKYHWDSFSGIRTPENMSIVFPKGNTEQYRFNIVEKEISAKNEKILIITGDIHAFTKYKYPVYDFLGTNFVRYENSYFGNLLYRKYGEKTLTILLHKPFDNYPNKQPYLVSPAKGSIEKIMKELNNLSVGFDLINTPLGKLQDNSYYSMGYENFTLSQIYDGYIFIKPINELSSCTIDKQFLTEKNWPTAKSSMADPDWKKRPDSIDEYWKQIIEYANIPKRYLNVDKNN